MGLYRFNADTSSSGGGVLLHRLKPIPITTQLYGYGNNLPVIRVGAGDKSFGLQSNTAITLYTTSSLGVVTATAVITYATYLAGGQPAAMHLNSADQCLYVLLRETNTLQLIKISDSTGAVTAVGSSFVPVTPSNWPDSGTGKMLVGSVSGDIELVFNGFRHSLNKSTGAIVTQDVAASLGSFLAIGVSYITIDGLVGLQNSGNTAVYGQDSVCDFQGSIHSTYGHVSKYSLSRQQTGGVFFGQVSNLPLNERGWMLVDSDKVASFEFSTGGGNNGVKLYLRTEFDKFVRSVAELGAGVI